MSFDIYSALDEMCLQRQATAFFCRYMAGRGRVSQEGKGQEGGEGICQIQEEVR